MRVDLCYHWSSFAATFENIFNDSGMSFLIRYPLGLCFHGLLLLGMNFLFSLLLCFDFHSMVPGFYGEGEKEKDP